MGYEETYPLLNIDPRKEAVPWDGKSHAAMLMTFVVGLEFVSVLMIPLALVGVMAVVYLKRGVRFGFCMSVVCLQIVLGIGLIYGGLFFGLRGVRADFWVPPVCIGLMLLVPSGIAALILCSAETKKSFV